ncbi:hypothetical protein NFJ49_04535 [Citrobacter braakii]|uniref:hypothetical protein n=1 Tax=Citrobacter braakii TaxID=57706 RepID=UPI00116D67E3|nr:hypothetical protein [Citrobacter braakii]MDU5157573.1 hypothetical protein [Citrobacter sp.]MEB0940921.1 hypothetical protein [Citrobacter braakii]MEB0946076.1 hypothetical protein [Citrobacter braakii]MEB0972649.1 hypothetical protein [Citrobacter braakii]MEB0995332.1 hypothetical protein [Citrobacter braakii]
MFTLYNSRDFSQSARLEDFEKIISPKEGIRLARIYYELDDDKNQRSTIFGLPQRKWNVNRYSSGAYERPPIGRCNRIYDEIQHKLSVGWIIAIDYDEHWSWDRNPFYFDQDGELVYEPFMPDVFDSIFAERVRRAYQETLDRGLERKPRPTQKIEYGAPGYLEPTLKPLTVVPRHSCPVEEDKPSREPVDAGFCVLPYDATPSSFESRFFINPPDGTRELYHKLNPDIKKQPGSILLVVDPEKQDQQQIETLQKARDRIDNALAPLTLPEARVLHENRASVDIFSSQLYSDALGQSGDILGYIKDTGGGYYEEINKTLNEIQALYKKTYSSNSGRISGEEFFGQRERLFKKLDGILNKFSKERLNLKQYEDIKQALGLSTKSIMHKWDQTGVKDIEGYASYIEKSAKLIKIMRTTGYVGVGLDFASYTTNVYEACAKGRESECRKAAITEYSKFGFKQTASFAGGAAGGIMGRAACTWVLGLITSEAGGIGASVCLVSGIASSIAGGKFLEKMGEKLGDRFGGLVNDDIDNPELKLYDPDSFNEAAGILIYEKIFNR